MIRNPYETKPFRPSGDNTIRPGNFKITEEMVGPCSFPPGGAILDIGCGLGATVAYLRKTCGLNASGVDSSTRMLNKALQLHPGFPLLEASAEALPFDSDFFDGIIAECSLSIIGLSDPVLAEINRVLKKGGRLLISDVYTRCPHRAAPLRSIGGRGCLSQIQSREELTQKLEASGFSIQEWVDKSNLLPSYIASSMMRNDPADPIWCGPSCDLTAIKAAKPGYFYLRARKEE